MRASLLHSFSLASRIWRCAAKRHRAFRSGIPNSGDRPGGWVAAPDGGQEDSGEGTLAASLAAAQGRLTSSCARLEFPRAARLPIASIREENAASERHAGKA